MGSAQCSAVVSVVLCTDYVNSKCHRAAIESIDAFCTTLRCEATGYWWRASPKAGSCHVWGWIPALQQPPMTGHRLI